MIIFLKIQKIKRKECALRWEQKPSAFIYTIMVYRVDVHANWSFSQNSHIAGRLWEKEITNMYGKRYM
jgi:hypothetical protein